MKADLNTINKVLSSATMLVSFGIEIDRSNGKYDLNLCLVVDESSENVITILFKDIENLDFKTPAAGWIQLMLLHVEQRNNGWERSLYVEECEYKELKFYCSTVEIENKEN